MLCESQQLISMVLHGEAGASPVHCICIRGLWISDSVTRYRAAQTVESTTLLCVIYFRKAKMEGLNKEGLKNTLTFKSSFTEYLGVTEQQLRRLMYSDKEKLYREFTVIKRSGKERIISAPSYFLKHVQGKIKLLLDQLYYPKSCVYGFVNARSIVSNAKKHANKNYLLNVDLKDFFPSITSKRVYGVMKRYGASPEVALSITKLVTFRGVLPQGAPTSPVISNMICGPLDSKLIKFSKHHKMRYSRYADDLTFSSNKPFNPEVFDSEARILGEELTTLITESGFEVNEEKIVFSTRRDHQEVTGLVVNEFVNLKRSYIRNLRWLLFTYKKWGKEAAHNLYYTKLHRTRNKTNEPTDIDFVLRGMLAFVKSVRTASDDKYHLYNSFAKEYNSLVHTGKVALYDPREFWLNSIVVIEYNYDGKVQTVQGTGFIVDDVYLVTAAHIIPYEEETETPKIGNINVETVNRDQTKTAILKTSSILLSQCIVARDSDADWMVIRLYQQHNAKQSFMFGDTKKIDQGSQVTITGFPNYAEGNMYQAMTYEVTSACSGIRAFEWNVLSVDGVLCHGISRGPVLNDKGKVIGVVSPGPATL